MNIKAIRSAGYSQTYPAGCYEVIIEFCAPQKHPNFGDTWGLGNFGDCKTYQGQKDLSLSGDAQFTGVVAYYNGRPSLEVSA